MRNKASDKKATVPIEEMSHTMMNHRMKTRITEYYFPYTSGRRISFKHHLNFILQGLKHKLPPFKNKKPFVSIRDERPGFRGSTLFEHV
jgi:hypothetical protein